MPETNTAVKKDFSRIGLALFTISIVTTVLQIIASVLWTICTMGTPLVNAEWANWILTFAPMYLIAVPIGLLIMRTVPVDSQPSANLGGKRFWLLMLICMPIMYSGNIIGNLLSLLLSGGTAENALLNYINSSPLYTFLFAVLAAPIVEEYIFRKQIIDRLGKYGDKAVIMVSAVTFGLFHMNLFQFFYAFGLGIIFAYVYTRTRRLRYPVFMHMLINFQGSVIAPWVLNQLDMGALETLMAGEMDFHLISEMLPGLLIYMAYATVLMLTVVAGFVLLILNWKKRLLSPAPEGITGKATCCNVGMILFTVFCLVMILISLFSGLL